MNADVNPADGDSLRLLREALDLDTHAERERLLGNRCKDRLSPFTAAALCSRAAVHSAQGRSAEARADLDAATAVFTGMGNGGERQLRSFDSLLEELAGGDRSVDVAESVAQVGREKASLSCRGPAR